MTKRILALEKDLFFSVRMRDTLRHHEMEVTAVRTLAAFEQRLTASTEEVGREGIDTRSASSAEDPYALVIVNTATMGVDWEAAIRLARAQGFPVLAFGSHMDLEARAKALKAGAQRVVANSKFTTDMPGLVQRMLSGSHAAVVDEADEE